MSQSPEHDTEPRREPAGPAPGATVTQDVQEVTGGAVAGLVGDNLAGSSIDVTQDVQEVAGGKLAGVAGGNLDDASIEVTQDVQEVAGGEVAGLVSDNLDGSSIDVNQSINITPPKIPDSLWRALTVVVALAGVLILVGAAALVRPLIAPRAGTTRGGIVAPMPSCAVPVDEELKSAWNPARLGCATQQARYVWSAWQPFQYGYMLWRQDQETAPFYVLYWRDRKTPDAGDWETSDKWNCGDNCSVSGAAPTPPSEELYVPESGFGYVWSMLRGWDSSIGWANRSEIGFCALIQDFDRGTMISSTTEACRKGDTNEWVPDSVSPFNHFPVTLYKGKTGQKGTWEGSPPP